MSNIPTKNCNYCGREMQYVGVYGFYGTYKCDCAKKEQALSIRRRIEEQKEKERAARLSPLADSCSHEWVGSTSPAYASCSKCGMRYGEYMRYKSK